MSTLKRVKQILKSRRGTAFPLIMLVTMSLLLVVAVALQISIINSITAGVKNEVQGDLNDDVQNNYTSVYYGNREENTAGYTPDGSGNWTDKTTSGLIQKVQNHYGLDDSLRRLDSSGNIRFQITNLNVSVSNPQTQNISSHYMETATYTLKIPVFVAGNALPSFSIRQTAKSGSTNRF